MIRQTEEQQHNCVQIHLRCSAANRDLLSGRYWSNRFAKLETVASPIRTSRRVLVTDCDSIRGGHQLHWGTVFCREMTGSARGPRMKKPL
jgi:hypothetical protein